MKIVMINGQNHKGSTYHVGKVLIDAITGDKEVKEFFLPRDLNHFCLGCYNCIEDEAKCPYVTEKRIIMTEVEAADLLILTTPNYCMAPSAPMKAFLDLNFTYWMAHKPRAEMFGKTAVVLSTTAGAGANQAIKPLARALSYWGISTIKKYGVAVAAMNWEGVKETKKCEIEKKMKKLGKFITTHHRKKVTLKTKLLFKMFAAMQRGNMGSSMTEKAYWAEKGWLDHETPWQ